jgi:hypothetical protein
MKKLEKYFGEKKANELEREIHVVRNLMVQ